MRVVFVGIGDAVAHAVTQLVEQGHEVVVVELDRDEIERYAERLDCSFLEGDGSKPDILTEVGPEETDVLFCTTDDDQANILSSLVGRSLGFSRVVTSIRDEAFEPICVKLGLEDTIIPSRTTGRSLADLVSGAEVPELSAVLRGKGRFFLLVVAEDDAGPVAELDLPEGARAVCLYHDGEFELVDEDSRVEAGDEVVVLTYRDRLEALRERFPAPDGGDEGKEGKEEEEEAPG